MPDLVEWLETAISEREEAAKNAGGMRWVTSVPGMVHVDPRQQADNYYAFRTQGYVATVESPAHGEHLRLNDPAAVLRRCAADRKIIDEYREAQAAERNYAEMEWPPSMQERGRLERSDAAARTRAMYFAVEALAAGYGYQPDHVSCGNAGTSTSA